MNFYRARLIRPGVAKRGPDLREFMPPETLMSLDCRGLRIRYGHEPDAETIGMVVDAEWRPEGFVEAILETWEPPKVRACSLGGELTLLHKPGRWMPAKIEFDAVVTAFDVDHLALVERGLFPDCEVVEEIIGESTVPPCTSDRPIRASGASSTSTPMRQSWCAANARTALSRTAPAIFSDDGAYRPTR